jgi:hypothetical protein
MARPSLAHRLTRRQDRLFDRLRDRSPLPADATATSFDALAGARYALVVTYRRSGEPVPTPMWFGVDGDRVYARSLADAAKVARLRRDPRVRVAPCTSRGRPTGPFAEGVGRVLSPEESDAAERALDRHYGRPRRIYEGAGTRMGVQTVYLEITMPDVTPVPEHLHTVTPRLVVNDGAAAIDFYGAAFGAEPLGEPFTSPDGKVIHAEIRIGDSVVMVTEEDATPTDRVTAMMATYWADVDAAWQRALDAGAEVIHPLADQFYGERAGRLRDPFGQQWMLAKRVEIVSADEMARRAADYFAGS